MTTTDSIAARFTTPDGLKKHFGFLGGKRAKASHELISRADASGVAAAYTLDRREYEGSSYYVKAVSTRGDLDEGTLAELTRQATMLPLGTLRYEGMMAPTMPDAVGSDHESASIHGLSRLEQGIIVYPVSIMSKKGDAGHAFWVNAGGQWFVEPIDDKKL
jgi:hypothetical protein